MKNFIPGLELSELFYNEAAIETVEKFFGWYLGCNPYQSLTAADWLTFSEHKLLAVTSGKVFHDGLGELEDVRRKFHYPGMFGFISLLRSGSRFSRNVSLLVGVETLETNWAR